MSCGVALGDDDWLSLPGSGVTVELANKQSLSGCVHSVDPEKRTLILTVLDEVQRSQFRTLVLKI